MLLVEKVQAKAWTGTLPHPSRYTTLSQFRLRRRLTLSEDARGSLACHVVHPDGAPPSEAPAVRVSQDEHVPAIGFKWSV